MCESLAQTTRNFSSSSGAGGSSIFDPHTPIINLLRANFPKHARIFPIKKMLRRSMQWLRQSPRKQGKVIVFIPTISMDLMTIDMIIANPTTAKKFRKFLDRKFCAEHFDFLKALQDDLDCELIYSTYIINSCSAPINISEKVYQAITDDISAGCDNVEIFDEAKIEVVDMLVFALDEFTNGV